MLSLLAKSRPRGLDWLNKAKLTNKLGLSCTKLSYGAFPIMDLWVAFVTAMKQKNKQAVSELSNTQERHIVTTPTLPQLSLSLV